MESYAQNHTLLSGYKNYHTGRLHKKLLPVRITLDEIEEGYFSKDLPCRMICVIHITQAVNAGKRYIASDIASR
ncbi:MAG: hypothetical protein ACR5K4_03985 [Sodalis sp. (in: enterobacteria)]